MQEKQAQNQIFLVTQKTTRSYPSLFIHSLSTVTHCEGVQFPVLLGGVLPSLPDLSPPELLRGNAPWLDRVCSEEDLVSIVDFCVVKSEFTLLIPI